MVNESALAFVLAAALILVDVASAAESTDPARRELRRRTLVFDDDSVALRQSYQLDYGAVSERYIVLNVNSSDQASFASMFSALEYMGRVERLPLIDTAVLEDDRGYYVRMRASLDQEQFPGPLRLLAFWRRDWSIASEWYRWPLRSE